MAGTETKRGVEKGGHTLRGRANSLRSLACVAGAVPLLHARVDCSSRDSGAQSLLPRQAEARGTLNARARKPVARHICFLATN